MKQKQTKEQNVYDLEEAKDHTPCPKSKPSEAAAQQLEVIKCYCASIISNRIQQESLKLQKRRKAPMPNTNPSHINQRQEGFHTLLVFQ